MTFKIIPFVYADGVADSTIDITSSLGTTFFKFKCIADLIVKTVNLAIVLSGVILFVMLIWAGVQWLTSGGDKSHIEEARNRITHAFIGITIVAAAWAIWTLAIAFFGIKGDICNPSTI